MIKNAKIFHIGLVFITENIISKAMIKKKAKVGSPLRAPFSNLKYDVVLPSLITQDYRLVNNILIQSMKLLPKPIFFLKQAAKIHDQGSRKLF